MELADAAIVTRAFRRDDDAERGELFRALVDGSLDRQYRLAGVILGNAVDAQDAVHDALVLAWERFGGLRDHDRFEAWFGRILVNRCRDLLRARGRHAATELMVAPRESDEVGGPFRDPGERAAGRDAVARAFGALTVDERLVLVLRYWEDLPVDDIAERLGIPSGTVKSRLHAATGRFASALRIQHGDGR